MATAVHVPQLNVNETTVTVVAVHSANGSSVAAGDLLATVESTKSAVDVEAPAPGIVRNLSATEGDRVDVGAVLCHLAETEDEVVEPPTPVEARPVEGRVSRRARELMEERGLDPASFGGIAFVRERHVLERIEQAATGAGPLELPPPEPDDVIVYGAGGRGRVCIELVRQAGIHRIVGLVDDGRSGGEEVGIPVLGGAERLAAIRAHA